MDECSQRSLETEILRVTDLSLETFRHRFQALDVQSHAYSNLHISPDHVYEVWQDLFPDLRRQFLHMESREFIVVQQLIPLFAKSLPMGIVRDKPRHTNEIAVVKFAALIKIAKTGTGHI